MKAILVASTLVLAVLSNAAMGQRSFNPGRNGEAPAAATQQDPQAEAKARFDAWLAKIRTCFTRAGLTEGKHFGLPRGATTFKVNDLVWISEGFNVVAIKKCYEITQ